jgi:hypothetical protein
LPAQGTQAVFANVTREELRLFSDVFPALRSVPDFSGRLDAAVLLANGGEWILTSPSADASLPSENARLLRQPVLASDPAILDKLNADAVRLRESPAFSRLMRGVMTASPRAYFESAVDAGALPAIVAPFAGASGSLLLALQNGVVIIRTDAAPFAQPSIGKSLTLLSPAPDASLLLSAPAKMLELFLKQQPEEGAIRRGQMTALTRELFGGDEWSFTYDLLPPLGRESALHWRSGTGGLSVLFQGEMPAASMQRRLAALHESARARLSSSAVDDRRLDRFRSVILRAATGPAEDRTYNQNGWAMRETRDAGDDRVFVSAVRGQQFIVSNRKEWMDEAVAGAGAALSRLAGSPAAGGMLSQTTLREVLGEQWNAPAWTWIRARMGEQGAFLWSAESDGQSLTLSLTLPPQ